MVSLRLSASISADGNPIRFHPPGALRSPGDSSSYPLLRRLLCDYAREEYYWYYAGVDVLTQAVSRYIGTTASGATNEEEQKLTTFKEMEMIWDKGSRWGPERYVLIVILDRFLLQVFPLFVCSFLRSEAFQM